MFTFDFVSAKIKHSSWKHKMRSYLDGNSTMTESQAVSHRDCDLGKWLYTDGQANFSSMSEFQELERIHENLHSYVRDIISMKSSGDLHGAETKYTLLDTSSRRILDLLDVLDAKVSAM